MKSFLWFLLALMTALPAYAQADRLVYDHLIRPDSALYYHTPLGLCEDYPEESTTLDIIRKDFALMQQVDVPLLRFAFGWDAIEAEEDKYDWLFWDELVEMAVDDYGITIIPYLMYTPKWQSPKPNDPGYWSHPPKDYDEFGTFVYDIVTRYKDRIKVWEVWGEPNLELWWGGTQEEYARLLRVASEAIHRADPDAVVVLGGLATYNLRWLETLFRDHGAAAYVDVVNLHNYYETWNWNPVENIDDYINLMHDIVHRYGEGEALWMAEVGYSTYRKEAFVSDVYTAYYEYEHTPAFQAVQLVRTITAALATEKLSALAWYEIKDLPPEEDVIGDELNNRFLGIAYADYTLKPSATALGFIADLYREPMRSLDDLVTAERALDSDVVLHTFEQEDGDVIVVGWLQTRRYGMQGDVGTGNHEDTRQQAVTVRIPRDLSGTATRYDELGNDQPFESVVHDNDETMLNLMLTGGTISIVHLEK